MNVETQTAPLSQCIGVVVDIERKEVRYIINPDYDYQLDDPAHITAGDDKLIMLKIPRKNMPKEMSKEDCGIIHMYVQHKLNGGA